MTHTPYRRLAWASAYGFLISVVLSLALPLVTLYAIELGASAALTGLLLTSGFILPTLASLAIGRWLDRVGSALGTRLGSLGFVLAPLAVVTLPSLSTLTIAHVLIGLSQVTSVIAVQRYVATISTSRERNFGWFATFVSIGQLLGPILLGIGLDLHDFRWLLLVTSGLGAVSLAATLAIPRRGDANAPSSPLDDAVRETTPLTTLWNTLRRRSAATTLAASFATLFALAVHQTFFPVYLELRDVPPTLLGFIMAMRGIASVGVRPFLATLTRLSGQHARLLAVAMIVTCIGLGAIPTSGHVAVLAFASFAIGAGTGIAQPLTMVMLSNLAAVGRHGAILGSRLTVNFIAMSTATLVMGALATTFGYAATFFVVTLIPLGAAIILANPGEASRASGRSHAS